MRNWPRTSPGIAPSLGKPLADFIYPAAEEAIGADDYKSAVRLLNAGLKVAKSFKKDNFVERRFELRLRSTQELLKAIEGAKGDDEALGRIECFRKNNWDRGLPLLAKSNDEMLAAAVKKDLAKPTESKDRADLGDAWFELAERSKGEDRIGMLRRAFSWYRLGVAGLSGLEKVKAETRITKVFEEVEAADSKQGIHTLWVVKPIARWKFTRNAHDSTGVMDGTLKGGATIANGRLRINGKGAYVETGSPPVDIDERTLEAWVYLPPSDRPVVVMRIWDIKTATWDGIIYREQQARKWYPGSSYRHRSQNLDAPDESAKPTERIHVAIVYAPDNSVTMYRNGKPYGASFTPQGDVSKLQLYKKSVSAIHFGSSDAGPIEIEEARLYNRSLTAEEIAESFRLRASRKN